MPNVIPLSAWWQRPDDSLIALNQDGVVTFSAFKLKISAWISVLEPYSGNRFAVFHHDAVEFLAILCALWQLSRTACIPGDALPGTTAKLTDHVDGFIGQFDVPETIEVSQSGMVEVIADWRPVSGDHIAIEVYTSGTTGEPKVIEKSMAVLEAELAALDTLMSSTRPEVTLSTVSHHHLYGLTFRLFRPFVYSIPFTTYLIEYLEDVIASAKGVSQFSLISSPAHLSRFNEHLDWHLVDNHCLDIISSAAPLGRKDSLLVSRCMQAPVKEVYGSSETGAIAWRTQRASMPDALWQPLAHVSITPVDEISISVKQQCNGELAVLEDEVSFNDEGHFSLHGRAGQLVKVEGKRLSLPALEKVLKASPFVDDARALVIAGRRTEVGAVLVLSEQGVTEVQASGRKLFVQVLKGYVKDFFEAATVPRRWRFVESFPYNSQGKITKKALLDLFAETEVKWPELLLVEPKAESVLLRFFLSKNLIYFNGHFDQQAVLPGVVQVHWAEHFGRQHLKVVGEFKQVETLKFQQLLLSEQTVDLTLRYDKEKQKLSFQYETERGVHSSGKISYE